MGTGSTASRAALRVRAVKGPMNRPYTMPPRIPTMTLSATDRWSALFPPFSTRGNRIIVPPSWYPEKKRADPPRHVTHWSEHERLDTKPQFDRTTPTVRAPGIPGRRTSRQLTELGRGTPAPRRTPDLRSGACGYSPGPES